MALTPLMPSVRRLVARRPWIQWLVIAALALGVAATVADALAGVDAARRAWGSTSTVWVAVEDAAPGDRIVVEPVEVPEAIRPPHAALEPGGSIARQAIGSGEIVTDLDVVDDDSLAPAGWLIAPVREALPSGASIGERVQVAADGFVVAPDGVVVSFVDDVTLVAVPADVAALLPAASASTTVALLRSP